VISNASFLKSGMLIGLETLYWSKYYTRVFYAFSMQITEYYS
jgi:hypothetical protein